jgi:toxin ParE1/3/4
MRVVWSAEARRAIDQIFTYIATDNPGAASRVADAIISAGNSLEQFPERYPHRGGGVRQQRVVGTKYLIRYRIERTHPSGPRVLIIAVRHGAQLG